MTVRYFKSNLLSGRWCFRDGFIFGVLVGVVSWFNCTSPPPPSSSLIPFFGDYVAAFFIENALAGVLCGLIMHQLVPASIGLCVGLYLSDVVIEGEYQREFVGPQIFPSFFVIPLFVLFVFVPGCIAGGRARRIVTWAIRPDGARAFFSWLSDSGDREGGR